MSAEMEPVGRLTRDLVASSKTLGAHEARFLVDTYYAMQKQRIRAGNQLRALTESEEPHEVLNWMQAQSETLEGQVKRALAKYAEASRAGQWALSQIGIGPVLTAGLLAHVDITKSPTVGHIWRFAGLDPNVIWPSVEEAMKWAAEFSDHHPDAPMTHAIEHAAKMFGRNPESLKRMASTNSDGEQVRITATTLSKALARRPWNAELKTLCWKIGESFVKFKGRDDCFYGKLYEQRRAQEQLKSDSGAYAQQARATLEDVPNHAQRTTYAEGKLPDGRLHLRAQRWAVKIFLAHFHDELYRQHYGKAPPLPYPIAHLGHAHVIEKPSTNE